MSTTKPKVKPLKTWVVKCHDGQHNDTWEIQAGDRQSAKDWAAQKHGTFSTYYLTAKLKK